MQESELLTYFSLRFTEITRTIYPDSSAAAAVVVFENRDPALVRVLWRDRPGYPKEQIKKILNALNHLREMLEEELQE